MMTEEIELKHQIVIDMFKRGCSRKEIEDATGYGLGKMVYPEPEDYVFETAIQALEEIQQYRAIGTVERLNTLQQDYWKLNEMCKEYSAIGTIEEFKALKEKNEPIANGEWIDTQPGYNNGYYKNVRVCSNCHDYYTTEYDEMKFCPKCGAKMTES